MSTKRIILPAILGNTNEWYDHALYGYFAPIIAQVFFPKQQQTTALLFTFAVFFIGFIARPFGAILLGHVGDRYGRRQALIISILLMGASTATIGLLPSYASIGFVAPLLLILLRILQGLAVSGELSGATTLLVESSKSHKRGFISSFVMFSIYLGQLLGCLVGWAIITLFPHHIVITWAWRIPFWLSAGFTLLILILRLFTNESPHFIEYKQQSKEKILPIKFIYDHYRRPVLQVIAIVCIAAIAGYLLVGFLPTYLLTQHAFSYKNSFFINSSIMFMIMLLLPFIAWLSDKYGRKIFLTIGATGFALFSLPIFWLLTQHSILLALCAALIFSVLLACINGVLLIAIAELFPTAVRQSGVGISFNIALAIFGGSAPLVAQWLIQFTHNPFSIAWFLIAAALFSLPFIIKLSIPEQLLHFPVHSAQMPSMSISK